MGSSESATEQPMIVMGKVRRSYRGPARRKIVAVAIRELTVARGSGLLLIGPNGSGKTTLLHLLSGLLRPDLGTVVVDGCDLTKLKEAKLDRFRARKIGYLLQNAQLLEGFTAEENIMAALLFSKIWVPLGNSGRARVSAFAPMPISPELQRLLQGEMQ